MGDFNTTFTPIIRPPRQKLKTETIESILISYWVFLTSSQIYDPFFIFFNSTQNILIKPAESNLCFFSMYVFRLDGLGLCILSGSLSLEKSYFPSLNSH